MGIAKYIKTKIVVLIVDLFAMVSYVWAVENGETPLCLFINWLVHKFGHVALRVSMLVLFPRPCQEPAKNFPSACNCQEPAKNVPEPTAEFTRQER